MLPATQAVAPSAIETATLNTDASVTRLPIAPAVVACWNCGRATTDTEGRWCGQCYVQEVPF